MHAFIMCFKQYLMPTNGTREELATWHANDETTW